MINTYICRC